MCGSKHQCVVIHYSIHRKLPYRDLGIPQGLCAKGMVSACGAVGRGGPIAWWGLAGGSEVIGGCGLEGENGTTSLSLCFLAALGEQVPLRRCSLHYNWPWSETMSLNKPFLLRSCSSQVFR